MSGRLLDGGWLVGSTVSKQMRQVRGSQCFAGCGFCCSGFAPWLPPKAPGMLDASVERSECGGGAGTSSGQCHSECGLKAVEDMLVVEFDSRNYVIMAEYGKIINWPASSSEKQKMP